MDDSHYPPIDGYGFIADCHSAALIPKSGSIDWRCMPRFDLASIFGRILDWGNGGHCRNVPLEDWKRARDEMRSVMEEMGYDTGRGVFIQAFDHRVMDASLLLLPAVNFVDYGDERMLRTTDATREELDEDGLLRRYPAGDDGMDGEEGAFVACAFWLADCLARQSRIEEARKVFKRALATGNDLCLFSEEYDPGANQMLGNFPQALTHLSLISAAVALREMEERKR